MISQRPLSNDLLLPRFQLAPQVRRRTAYLPASVLLPLLLNRYSGALDNMRLRFCPPDRICQKLNSIIRIKRLIAVFQKPIHLHLEGRPVLFFPAGHYFDFRGAFPPCATETESFEAFRGIVFGGVEPLAPVVGVTLHQRSLLGWNIDFTVDWRQVEIAAENAVVTERLIVHDDFWLTAFEAFRARELIRRSRRRRPSLEFRPVQHLEPCLQHPVEYRAPTIRFHLIFRRSCGPSAVVAVEIGTEDDVEFAAVDAAWHGV